jgi:hypothetical protein
MKRRASRKPASAQAPPADVTANKQSTNKPPVAADVSDDTNQSNVALSEPVKRYVPPALRNKQSPSASSDTSTPSRPPVAQRVASKLRADTAVPFVPSTKQTVVIEQQSSKKQCAANEAAFSGEQHQIDLLQEFGRLSITSPSILPPPIASSTTTTATTPTKQGPQQVREIATTKSAEKQRPQTSALVANRMVAHALGIQMIRSPEREARDRLVVQQARGTYNPV